MLVRIEMPLDPREVARRLRRPRYDEERISGEPRDGQIAFESSACVEKARVNDAPDRHVDVVRAKTLQCRQGIATFEHEFRKRGLIEDDDVLAARALLLQHVRQPTRTAKRVCGSRHASWQKIVR